MSQFEFSPKKMEKQMDVASFLDAENAIPAMSEKGKKILGIFKDTTQFAMKLADDVTLG